MSIYIVTTKTLARLVNNKVTSIESKMKNIQLVRGSSTLFRTSTRTEEGEILHIHAALQQLTTYPKPGSVANPGLGGNFHHLVNIPMFKALGFHTLGSGLQVDKLQPVRRSALGR